MIQLLTEWNSPGDQTEPMCQLVLGGGSDSLLEQPDEADCIYYPRTGFCGYGSGCRFNHPVDRGGSVFGGVRSGGGEYPEHIGEPVCQEWILFLM
ncbi:putative transcription factor C3H family [Helianthus anomalus]